MIDNQEKALQIKELLQTMLEVIPEIQKLLIDGKMISFDELSFDLKKALFKIKKVAENEKEEVLYNELEKIIINCLVSLERIIKYAVYNQEKALHKVEFELWPLLRYAYARFYFLALIDGDEDRMNEWYRSEGKELCKNYYLERARESGEYKYDISIVVLAYNKLEYTKLCVESVLRNIPKHLKCELILINHGSTDGTKEYFESIHPHKQFDMKVNGGGSGAVPFIYEGKYSLAISNDVIITPNTIEILYEAFEENVSYGFAVPMTSNICNMQEPISLNNGGNEKYPSGYASIHEIDGFASKINIRNPLKEEKRFRLCNPLSFIRVECNDIPEQVSLYSLMVTRGYRLMFPDDFMSMYIRRHGYNNILMKDIYCHHFGSITIKDEKKENVNYLQGRKLFLEKNGIDPWGKGFCWQYRLFDKLLCDKADSKQILGINCGLGSDVLKIQQEIRANTGNDSVEIISMTDNERDLPDLECISKETYLHQGWDDILNNMAGEYDYILVSDKLEECEEYSICVDKLYQHVKKDGTIIIYVPSTAPKIEEWILQSYDNVTETVEFDVTCSVEQILNGDIPEKGKYLFWKKI